MAERPKLTERQRAVFRDVVRATVRADVWVRAQCSGERVTLASLHARGLLERRVWRAGKSSADNAHEYRASAIVLEAIKSVAHAVAGVST